MSKLEENFIKGASDNLPKVDFEMISDFFLTNANFLSAEMRNVKTDRATKQSYGDNAVEYVQLKREGHICTVKARITPEHKVRQKGYVVSAIINENEEIIVSSDCIDCAASTGGCKHGVAFLLWLHRRSEETAVTSTKCYWKKSKLSKVSSGNKKITTLFQKTLPPLSQKNSNLVNQFISICPNATGGIFDLHRPSKYENISVHQLMMRYTQESAVHSPALFIAFAKTIMDEDLCSQAEAWTRDQSESLEWHELRYGRVTASILYQVSRCKTSGGTLTERILGAARPLQTEAISRGKLLEKEVIKVVASERKLKINEAGLFLNSEFPVFGASPDGITDLYVIEVKCSSKEKTVGRYIVDNKITKKYYFQIQMQMLFASKTKGLFCVASPFFETNKQVTIIEVELNREEVPIEYNVCSRRVLAI